MRNIQLGDEPQLQPTPKVPKPKVERLPVMIPPGHWIQGWRDVIVWVGLWIAIASILIRMSQCYQADEIQSTLQRKEAGDQKIRCLEATDNQNPDNCRYF